MNYNPEKAVKKTTNKIIDTADKSGTRCLNRKINPDPLKTDYVNETHVSDFIKALAYDPTSEHISAWSEALPGRPNVRPEKTKKRLIQQEAAKPSGISFSLFRYPLVVKIMSILLSFVYSYIFLVHYWIHHLY